MMHTPKMKSPRCGKVEVMYGLFKKMHWQKTSPNFYDNLIEIIMSKYDYPNLVGDKQLKSDSICESS